MVMERHQEKQYYTLNVRPVTGCWFLEQEGFCWGGHTKRAGSTRDQKWAPRTTWRGDRHSDGFKSEEAFART